MAKKNNCNYAQQPSDSSSTPSWLLSFGASDIGVRARKQGELTFVIDSKNVSTVTTFTDRPDRVTGQMKMSRLARSFTNMFGTNYPNASITHWTDGKFYNGVFEVKSIRKRRNKFYLKTDVLIEDHGRGSLAHDPNLVKMAGLFDDFAATKVIDNASFFVDNFGGLDCMVPFGTC